MPLLRCSVLYFLTLSLFSFNLAIAGPSPCTSDGSLKSWAIKKGYSVDSCNNTPTNEDSNTTEDSNPNICGKDGSLKGWARKAGYSDSSCSSTVNTTPTLTIVSPTNTTQIEEGTISHFSANAYDQEDGDLSSSIEWYSSQDGQLFGDQALSVGIHTITASVSDSAGATISSSIEIEVISIPVQSTYATLLLDWTPPLLREDGTALTLDEIGGYEIVMVDASNTENTIQLIGGSTSSYSIEVERGNTYFFAISSYDATGIYSTPSEPVQIQVD